MTKIDVFSTIEPFLDKIYLVPPDVPENLNHLYADYIELLSLFSKDIVFTISEVLDRFKDVGIIKQRKKSEDQAEQNDQNERWVTQIFQILEDRSFNYKSKYPFVYHARSVTLSEELTDIQKLYIFLLISSNLNIFEKYIPHLTMDFEEISFQALSNFMPFPAIVKAFGKTTTYKGYAVDKIKHLAGEIKIPLNEEALSRISAKGRMERGLDVVAWVPFDDWVGNKLVILGQCTCEKKWFKKQTEAKRYKSYFKFYGVLPSTALFIPYALIDFQQNGFHQGDEVIENLLFERKRILDYLKDLSFFDSLDSKIIVEKCLIMKSDIV